MIYKVECSGDFMLTCRYIEEPYEKAALRIMDYSIRTHSFTFTPRLVQQEIVLPMRTHYFGSFDICGYICITPNSPTQKLSIKDRITTNSSSSEHAYHRISDLQLEIERRTGMMLVAQKVNIQPADVVPAQWAEFYCHYYFLEGGEEWDLKCYEK